jgi:hypothetical protein
MMSSVVWANQAGASSWTSLVSPEAAASRPNQRSFSYKEYESWVSDSLRVITDLVGLV